VEDAYEILEGPERFEDKGLAARLTYDQEEDSYRVEHSPLLKTGEIAGEWGVFGGSVGYNASTYNSEEDAREFFNDLENLEAEEVLDEFAVGEE